MSISSFPSCSPPAQATSSDPNHYNLPALVLVPLQHSFPTEAKMIFPKYIPDYVPIRLKYFLNSPLLLEYNSNNSFRGFTGQTDTVLVYFCGFIFHHCLHAHLLPSPHPLIILNSVSMLCSLTPRLCPLPANPCPTCFI